MESRWKKAALTVLGREVKPGLSPEAVIDPEFEHELDQLHNALKADRSAGTAPHALLCGLYLMNGSLDKSHALSQNIHDATGSFWHGIMHRMEPDYDNARYWFRRTGRHPVMESLGEKAAAYLAQPGVMPPRGSRPAEALSRLIAPGQAWDPFLWIDIVAGQAQGEFGREALPAVLHLQWIELTELLDFSYRACFGGSLIDR